jgi:nucleotide-binding universal stress UspA family protein
MEGPTMNETTATIAGAATGEVPTAPPAPFIVAVGGRESDGVLRAARILEQRTRGGVVAVGVLELPSATVTGAEPALMVPSYLDEQREEYRMSLREHLLNFGGAAALWPATVIDGEPAFALTDYARTIGAPLIVMGLGRHRAIDRVLGREITLRTIRLAPCPVLAVRPDLDVPFQDVVVATDFSAASAYAAQVAIRLIDPQATLHLVHVWEPTSTDDAHVLAMDDSYRASLPEHFRRFTEILAPPAGIEVKTIVREGKPAERVLDYAAAHHADLLVAGRHGLNMFERFLAGSQTTSMLRGAECSILVAPEPPLPVRDRLRLLLGGATRSTKPRSPWRTGECGRRRTLLTPGIRWW